MPTIGSRAGFWRPSAQPPTGHFRGVLPQ